MKTFYAVIANSLVASLTNTSAWFAITFWVYLQTESVIATSVMAGVYTVIVAVSGFFLGSLVDRYPKKTAMLLSSVCSLGAYALALVICVATPSQRFADPSSSQLWLFIVLILVGAIIGNLRAIALSTLVTILIGEEGRDRANGMVGTANGVAFVIASIISGLVIGYLGVLWMIALALGLTALVILHLLALPIPQAVAQAGQGRSAAATNDMPSGNGLDLRGTIRVIGLVPGLFGLLFFNTFNNFLGGVHMALMDAYGLTLVSVQVWGVLAAVLSLGFIMGGLVIARTGLGKNPLRTLFVCNIVMWSIYAAFSIWASIIPLAIGFFVFVSLVPVVEAAEQTLLQKVIPLERQGRVFGFAQSVEQAASPITAFLIGPMTQLFFIPFMTTGVGVALIGDWFGTGTNRGIALVFILAGLIGLVVTLLAMRSQASRVLSENYQKLQIGGDTAAMPTSKVLHRYDLGVSSSHLVKLISRLKGETP